MSAEDIRMRREKFLSRLSATDDKSANPDFLESQGATVQEVPKEDRIVEDESEVEGSGELSIEPEVTEEVTIEQEDKHEVPKQVTTCADIVDGDEQIVPQSSNDGHSGLKFTFNINIDIPKGFKQPASSDLADMVKSFFCGLVPQNSLMGPRQGNSSKVFEVEDNFPSASSTSVPSSVSEASQPSTSAASCRSLIDASRPSTSAASSYSLMDASQPSTSTASCRSLFDASRPSTSAASSYSLMDASQPSTSSQSIIDLTTGDDDFDHLTPDYFSDIYDDLSFMNGLRDDSEDEGGETTESHDINPDDPPPKRRKCLSLKKRCCTENDNQTPKDNLKQYLNTLKSVAGPSTSGSNAARNQVVAAAPASQQHAAQAPPARQLLAQAAPANPQVPQPPPIPIYQAAPAPQPAPNPIPQAAQAPPQVPQAVQVPPQVPQAAQAPPQVPQAVQVPPQVPQAAQAPPPLPQAGQPDDANLARCSVCYENTVNARLACNHMFCVACLEVCKNMKRPCPSCRRRFRVWKPVYFT